MVPLSGTRVCNTFNESGAGYLLQDVIHFAGKLFAYYKKMYYLCIVNR